MEIDDLFEKIYQSEDLAQKRNNLKAECILFDAQHSKRVLIRGLENIFGTNKCTRMILVSFYLETVVVDRI